MLEKAFEEWIKKVEKASALAQAAHEVDLRETAKEFRGDHPGAFKNGWITTANRWRRHSVGAGDE